MVLVAIVRSLVSVVVVRMCRIRCCTLSLVVRKLGKAERTFKARPLAWESFETRLSSIRLRNISLELRGSIYWILSLYLQKIREAISDLNLFVALKLKISASWRQVDSMIWVSESGSLWKKIEISSMASS